MSAFVERPDGSVDSFVDEIAEHDTDYARFDYVAATYRFQVEPDSEALRVFREVFGVERDAESNRHQVVPRRTEEAAYYRPTQWTTVKHS